MEEINLRVPKKAVVGDGQGLDRPRGLTVRLDKHLPEIAVGVEEGRVLQERIEGLYVNGGEGQVDVRSCDCAGRGRLLMRALINRRQPGVRGVAVPLSNHFVGASSGEDAPGRAKVGCDHALEVEEDEGILVDLVADDVVDGGQVLARVRPVGAGAAGGDLAPVAGEKTNAFLFEKVEQRFGELPQAQVGATAMLSATISLIFLVSPALNSLSLILIR